MSNWLVSLPEHRFNALKKKRRSVMKKLESEYSRGFLKSAAKLEYARQRFGDIKSAEKLRCGSGK